MEFELGEICVAGNTVTDGYDECLVQPEMHDLFINPKIITEWEIGIGTGR